MSTSPIVTAWTATPARLQRTTRVAFTLAGTDDRIVRVTDQDDAWIELKVAPDGHRSAWAHSLRFATQREAIDWFASIDPWVADPSREQLDF